MTTRFKPDDLTEGLTGAIHETGHALYEQGRNLELDGLPINEVLSWATITYIIFLYISCICDGLLYSLLVGCCVILGVHLLHGRGAQTGARGICQS